MVANDYTVRFENRIYQVDKPIYPGLRRGRVVLEVRLDGTMAIRFGDKYLKYHEVASRGTALGGAAPQTPRSLTLLRPTPVCKDRDRTEQAVRSPGVQPTVRRSGRTPAEPYLPDGGAKDSAKEPYRPAENHPWRKPFKRRKR